MRIVQPGDAAVLAEAYRRNREHLAPWEPLRDEGFFTERFQREDIERRLIATAARPARWCTTPLLNSLYQVILHD